MTDQVETKQVDREALIEKRKAEGRCIDCGKPAMQTKDGYGLTCYAHQGKREATATRAASVPEGWVRMSKVCRALEDKGFKTSEIVRACGGDACTDPVLDPIFRVTYVGRGKWLSPEVLVRGAELLAKARKAPAAETGKPSDTANALKQVVKPAAK